MLGIVVRDPERIPRILGKLERVWEHESDLRLGQLTTSVARLATWPPEDVDLFFLEDDDFERALDIILQNIEKETSPFVNRTQRDLKEK